MAAASILLPNGDYVPAQSFSQDGHTTKSQEVVVCDASGNVVGVVSNRLDVNVGAALPAGTNNIGDVDVLTLPAIPAGNNNIGDVDIASALPAGTNNIGDVDVLSLPAIPAGNNNIGDVDVASLPAIPAGTNNIGDVDVLSLPAIPAGTNNIGDVDVATAAPDVTAAGLMDAVDETVTLTVPAGANAFGILLTGTIASGSVVTVEGSVDGTTWDPLAVQTLGVVNSASVTSISGATVVFGGNQFIASCAGMAQVRVRLSTFTAADSVTATLRARVGSGVTHLMNPINMIGDVAHDAANSAITVQVGGHARSGPDDPPTLVASADRARFLADRAGAQIVRPRRVRDSYTAVFRLGETTARLDQTFTHTANTTKQYATLHHTSSATKDLRLVKCVVWITAWSAATQAVLELHHLAATTAPASGNPAITPRPHRLGSTAADATALYLPTTQGSYTAVDAPLGHLPLDPGTMGAVSTVNPLPPPTPLVLFSSGEEDAEEIPPTIPLGVGGGFAVTLRTVGTPAVRLTAALRFVEEIV